MEAKIEMPTFEWDQSGVAVVARRCLQIALVLLLSPLFASPDDNPNNGPNHAARRDYSEMIDILRPFIQGELTEKEIPGLSIALIEDQQMVWAEGFGVADEKSKKPGTEYPVYRIGSVSKLFTEIAIMQLVERGELNLDAPVSDYLPDFHPKNPFGTPITLRQLMS